MSFKYEISRISVFATVFFKPAFHYLCQADAEINVDVPPDYVAPDTEKLELQRLRSDIEKYFRSRLFLEQLKEDWASLLDPENTRWHPPERTVTWPLKEIIAYKERVKERQKQLEAAGN